MENFFVSSFVICFLVAAALHVATVVAIRRFMPVDWDWYNALTLDSDVWDKQVPASIRRIYVLTVFFFSLAVISLVPLALIEGQIVGIVFAFIVAGGLIYNLVWTWINYREKL